MPLVRRGSALIIMPPDLPKGIAMHLSNILTASAITLCLAASPRAKADVIYRVFNPAANNFTLFVYDAPTFITADTAVGVAQLTFASPLNTITTVEFIPASATFPGMSELDVIQSGGPEQFRYYPQGTFAQFGVTAGDSNSFGFPNSRLSVEAPEPASIAMFSVAVAGLLSMRRRRSKQSN